MLATAEVRRRAPLSAVCAEITTAYSGFTV
jgi:hypothetical protein